MLVNIHSAMTALGSAVQLEHDPRQVCVSNNMQHRFWSPEPHNYNRMAGTLQSPSTAVQTACQ